MNNNVELAIFLISLMGVFDHAKKKGAYYPRFVRVI
jgi:hypothetical protein